MQTTQGIAWNEDWAQYFVFAGDDAMDEAHLRRWVRQYAGTQIREFILNVNGMCASFPSKTIDRLTDGFDPENAERCITSSREITCECVGQRKWLRHLKMLEERGIDPYLVFVDEARACGMSPWISLRVNDMHCVTDEGHCLHDGFWREHPEYRTGEYRFKDTGDLYDRTLDYARPQVRARLLALASECAERYDMDGLELDFVRNDANFRRGFEETDMPLMTGMLREIRAMLDESAKRRGHTLRLGVRVPLEPEQALAWGLDVVAWAREGLTDFITPMNHYDCPMNAAPYALWRKLLGDDVTLCGGMDVGMRAYPGGRFHRMSLETVRGAADAMLYKGVDRVYLFNYHAAHSSLRETGRIIREVGCLDTLDGTLRRYVVGYNDGHMAGQTAASMLPRRLQAGELCDFRVDLGRIGDEPTVVRLGVCEIDGRPPRMTVRVNGTDCAYDDWVMSPDPGPGRCLYEFRVPKGAAHDGQNNVETLAREPMTLDWLEVTASPYGFDELLTFTRP